MVTNWFNAKKQKPPKGDLGFTSETVLISEGNKIGHGHYDFDRKTWECQFPNEYDHSSNDITHWQYFPKLPKIK